jgi:lipid-A-disaccharide synthase
MGFVEVCGTFPGTGGCCAESSAGCEAGASSLVVLLDYPGFNMKVARAAHAAGVPVLYYITPQVWAWGARLASLLARVVTQGGLHPALRGDRCCARTASTPPSSGIRCSTARRRCRRGRRRARRWGCRPTVRCSRCSREPGPGAGAALADAVAAAQRVRAARPDVEVVVAGAPTVTLRDGDVPFRVIRGASFPVLRAADAALCKSGTTTLEAAVADCPLVVVYRTNALTYAMAKRVVRIPHIGLVNVVAEREVAPEFVQERFTPSAVADALLPLLRPDAPERAAMLAGLAAVRGRLGTPGASARVAAMADAMLAGR